MQDRFKFRVWDKAIGEMVYDVCVGFIKDGFLGDWVSADTTWGQINYREDRLKDIELMQCTGLKDKNGKLIYEGDVLRYPEAEQFIKSFNSEHAPKPPKVIIEYFGHRLMGYVTGMDEYQDLIDWTDYIDNTTPLEIIGNIYENKELLEECK